MSFVLYGSMTSPYVRRIRMLLDDINYEFIAINLFDDEDRAKLNSVSPIRKLPTLVDGDVVLYDSHTIYEYVCEKHQLPVITVLQKNTLSVIDALTDSWVILFYGKASELEVSEDILLFRLQMQRIPRCLEMLELEAAQGAFKNWNYLTSSLIATLQWANFRNLVKLSDYPSLQKVVSNYAEIKIVKETYPS